MKNWLSRCSCNEQQIKRIFSTLTRKKKDKTMEAASRELDVGAATSTSAGSATSTTNAAPKRRGRPPKAMTGVVVADSNISTDIVESLGLDDSTIMIIEATRDLPAVLAAPDYDNL
jgi:hypothetical protein